MLILTHPQHYSTTEAETEAAARAAAGGGSYSQYQSILPVYTEEYSQTVL